MMVISLVVIPSFKGANHAEASSSTFKIAVIPDTQIYSMRHPEIFKAQTQWIADNWGRDAQAGTQDRTSTHLYEIPYESFSLQLVELSRCFTKNF